MAAKTLQLVPKPPDSKLFYLECTEEKPGEIYKLREFFNKRLTQFDEQGSTRPDIILLEIFTVQRRLIRKNLLGIRVLTDHLPDQKLDELDNLLNTLDINRVCEITGVTSGQYRAELKAGFDLKTTAETTAEQLKTTPNIKFSTAHNVCKPRNWIGDEVYQATATLMIDGDPGTVAAIYKIMEQNFANLQKSQGKFYYTHAISFSK